MKTILRSNTAISNRNYELAARVDKLSDHAFVDVHEVAATTGFSANSLRNRTQRERLNMPEPNDKVRHLTWRLGEIRRWQDGQAGHRTEIPELGNSTTEKKMGRPTKSEEMAKLGALA